MKKLLFVYLIILYCAPLVLAQNSAGVKGKVLDPAGAAIVDAEITLTNAGTSAAVHAMSDASGDFEISGLPTGTYTLDVSKTGFGPFHRDNLQLSAGQMTTSNVAMTLKSVSESLTVNETELPGATLEPSQEQVFLSDQTVRVLDRKQMDVAGPVAGAAQIIALTPGANVSGYGNTGATKYTVTLNGINQGWGGYGGFTGGGSLGITLDGVPIVDPATSLWQSPTLPEMGMFQNVNVTYGPGAPNERWYTNIGGSVEFTPTQPSNQAHGDVTLTYGSYNQKDLVFNLGSGVYRGWSTVFSGGGDIGNDFRVGYGDNFGNPSKDWALYNKTIKTYHQDSFAIGSYFAHAGGYRAQVIPLTPIQGITVNGQPTGALYSEQTSGYYSSLPYDNYNKYDTNEMGLIDARENIHVDDSTTIENMSWYMHIGRSHYRTQDVYSLGPQQDEYNDPHTNTIGDQISMTKHYLFNTFSVGGYFLHSLYNSRNNFYNPADGGDPFNHILNAGGKVRSSYFNQDDYALFFQDTIHPISFLYITPGIRYVDFQTGYSTGVFQDFTLAPGAVLSTSCAYTNSPNPIGVPSSSLVKNQGACPDAIENRSGFEPSFDVSLRANSWLTFYGNFQEELRAPAMGGGGGLFQAVDPASYHLSRGEYTQAGFKTHFEGSGWRNGLLFGADYFHAYYGSQEIDVALANGDTISGSGASMYQGVNFFFDEDPIKNLHVFFNGNFETAKYTTYQTSLVPPITTYSGLPVPYVPSSLFNLGAYYSFKLTRNLSIEPMASYQFVGSQHLFDNNGAIDVPGSNGPLPSTQTMPSYGTLNLSIRAPYKFMEFQFTALNVLNKQYNEYEYISAGSYFSTPTAGYILAYPASPFTAYGGIKFHF